MPLEEYKRKRTFSKTPEPAGSEREIGPSKDPFFCVQRHHATRLHYDFRLEIDGALKSWAIPKGPSLDPSVKRMAAHVEDHPMEYGNFEGNIPKGNYGAGSVMLWDRGTFELLGTGSANDQLAKGDLKFRLHGQKLNGEFAIVLMKGRGKGNEWLLIKKKDPYAVPGWDIEEFGASVLTKRTQEQIAAELPAPSAALGGDLGGYADRLAGLGAERVAMPDTITPMGAVLADKTPVGDDWLLEVKWDGIRAICFMEESSVRIVTRNGMRCERQYPELMVLPNHLRARQAVLDGEIVVLDPAGVSRFALIQPRIMTQDSGTIAQLARSKPVHLYLFDLLYLDGFDLRNVPLTKRRELLKEILKTDSRIRLSDTFENEESLVDAAIQNGLEGLVAKRSSSLYQPRRSREWEKIKFVQQQEFVICGFTDGERDHFGALVLGFYEKGELVWAGNVGTGFDRAQMAAIREKLDGLKTQKSPFAQSPLPKEIRLAHWVRPELVCQVKFSNWTPDNRLRAPVYLGMREDVAPEECARESDATAQPASPADRPKRVRAVSATAKAAAAAPLFPPDAAEVSATVDGHALKFTNLRKVFYPQQGFTKGDLLRYYDNVAAMLLPYLVNRPLSLKRYPNGIAADFFFQKDAAKSFPAWLAKVQIEENQMVMAQDRASLLYLTNLGCIDHNPWMSRVDSLENPDFLLIDLDAQGCEYSKIVEAAREIRTLLDAVELEGYAKTTGGDGMHIYVPVAPEYSYEIIRQFASVLASLAANRRPDLFTTPRAVAKRENNKVYFDWVQIAEGKTISAPYVARAYSGAPVATPLKWSEVTPDLLPSRFHIANARQRFDRVGDLFKPVLTAPQRLEDAFTQLES